MRLVLLALLVAAAAGLRQKRTLGIIFRGLVDANTKQIQTAMKKEPPKVEKLKSPPPATVYLIPIPERDKKSDVQLFNTPPSLMFHNKPSVKPPPHPNDHFVKAPPVVNEKKNFTDSEPKQFVIRIMNEHGKSIMLKIVGDDVQVKKKGDGYTIGVSHKEAKANINIELPDKADVTKGEVDHSNLVEKFSLPFFGDVTGPTSPEKYEQLDKEPDISEKLHPALALQGHYPYPIFLPPYFHPLPYESRHHPQKAAQESSAAEKPKESEKKYIPSYKKPDSETPPKKLTGNEDKPKHLHLTVSVKGEPVMKETVAEVGKKTTSEQPHTDTQHQGYHYPVPEPRYQQPPPYTAPGDYLPWKYPEPKYPEQKYPDPKYPDPKYPDPKFPDPKYPEPSYPDPNYPDPKYESNPPRYQWYYPQPQQQPPGPVDRSQEQQPAPWNFAQYTPYPSYLQDPAAPPYHPTGYGRVNRGTKCCGVY